MSIDKWVIIIDAKIMFDVGDCKTKEEALDQFKLQYPKIEERSKYIGVKRVVKDKNEIK
jgi:hypothetical protein